HFVRAADMRSVSFSALQPKQLPQTFGRLDAGPQARWLFYQRALALHARRETDNCASALWLLSFARASSLFRSASFCSLHLAKSILLDRCRKFRGNNPIQQMSGRIRQNILRDLLLQERRPKFR